jgi:very-short-patch-repair endonuclease
MIPWNKGLTNETDERVKRGSSRMSFALTGKKREALSIEHKKHISDGMKRAQKEGKAWNIGMSRWNNQPSYPEIFFMKVIENEFNDKEYKREFRFHRFSLDFVWEHRRKCIEIDGKQHEESEEQKKRDKRKDELLVKEGWEFIRIKWSDMFNDPRKWIDFAKDFLGC